MQNKDELFNTINEFLSIDDKKFDSVYANMKSTMIDECKSRAAQREMLDNLPRETDDSILDNMEDIEALVNEIEKASDGELSANKRNFLKESILASAKINRIIYETGKEQIPVKIELMNQTAKVPTYANPTDAGADVYSNEDVTIKPGETKIIKTGLKVAMPKGFMLNIYNRSGQAAKTKLRVANSVGIIDYLYHKEIGVILDNIGDEPITIHIGDRIAQMVIQRIPMIDWNVVDKIEDTERAGFGSTGK